MIRFSAINSLSLVSITSNTFKISDASSSETERLPERNQLVGLANISLKVVGPTKGTNK